MRIIPVLMLLLVSVASMAAEPHHAKVELDLSDPAAAEFLRQNGGRLDVLQVKPGSFAHIAALPRDLAMMRESGLSLRVLEVDMESAQAYRDKGIGYGIYHTWSETVAFVDSLRLLYPEVISEKWSLGQTDQGRDIWAFRVSDNPDVDEDEPEILLDAMHHAREIMSSEFTIMFAEYLAQGYGSDAQITWLLDNRELYIVPVVNPDGSVWNETTNPSGGGMWRKNRVDNGDGSFGVDPNRNYPYQWGYDDVGSSPIPEDITYRGPSAGSELEVQALMNFINSREFRTHDTIHSYSNLTLIPWGYTPAPTSDAIVFNHMAAEMTRYNGYAPGQPFEALNYSVNGGTFDWVYGDLTDHQKIYSFSNEIGSGSDGFWPAESRRADLFNDNIWPHIYLMRAAGAFVAVHSPVVIDPAKNFNQAIGPGQDGDLSFTIENQSVFESADGLTLTLRSDDPWVQFHEAVRTVSSLGTMASEDLAGDPVPFTVDPACPNGHLVSFTVTAHMPGGDLDYPMTFAVGSPVPIFQDDFQAGLGHWIIDGSWDLTSSESHSPALSLTDSPGGDYPNLSVTTVSLADTYLATSLSFWHRYDIEEGWDFGRVQISADGGPWTTLASFTGLAGWSETTLDFTEYSGQEIGVRFVMETDQTVVEDGWYIDDVSLVGLPSQDLALAVPQPISPAPGATVGASPVLTVSPGAKVFADPVVYGFMVYADELGTDLVASAANVADGGAQTSWTAPLLADGTYWWRAWAGDGTERTPLSPAVSFTVNGVSAVDGVVLGGPQLRVLGSVTGSGSRLELSLPGRADVQVDIHDARGARIRRLASESFSGGTRILVWDGRDAGGRAVSSGVYFVRVKAGRDVMTDRVVIVR